jgi:hypothetical protein
LDFGLPILGFLWIYDFLPGERLRGCWRSRWQHRQLLDQPSSVQYKKTKNIKNKK